MRMDETPEQVYIRLNGLVIKLKSLKSGISWLENHELVKNFLLVIMLTHEDMTFQIHRSPNFATLTPDDVFSIFKTHREYKETAQEMRMHCQLTKVAQARVQKPSLALKAREKVVVEVRKKMMMKMRPPSSIRKGWKKLLYLQRPSIKGSSQDSRESSPRDIASRSPKGFAMCVKAMIISFMSAQIPRREVTRTRARTRRDRSTSRVTRRRKPSWVCPIAPTPPPMKTKKKNTMEWSVWLFLLQAHLKQALLQQRLHHQIQL
jgi:hypothetical protein